MSCLNFTKVFWRNHCNVIAKRVNSSLGFTLVELLVCVAIVAIIATGATIVYGRNAVADARRQMTLHEMGQIRDAFLRFYADNIAQLERGIRNPGTAQWLPSADFAATFTGISSPTPATSHTRFDRHYATMEFFEKFGLWPLLRSSPQWTGHLSDEDFIAFNSPSPESANGWKGPYLAAQTLADWAPESEPSLHLPQVATKYGGIYRVLYYEHCVDESDEREPVLRRLLLTASQEPEAFDEWREFQQFCGNLRGGRDDGFPVDQNTGAVQMYSQTNKLFFVELLNLDKRR